MDGLSEEILVGKNTPVQLKMKKYRHSLPRRTTARGVHEF
jgi:hypothetical protein